MSEAEGYAFQAPLSIAIDFKSPHAYLALQPSFELIDSLGVQVDWLPFNANPQQTYEPVGPEAPRGARHRWIRARYQAHDLERAAARQDLNLTDIYRAPDTSLAGIGLLWLTREAPQGIRSYLQNCFAGLWDGTLDIEDETALTRLLGKPGFADFLRGSGRGEWNSLQEQLSAAGVFDVPTYVVEGQPFLGRQHLPMIRKLLEA